MEVDGLEAGLDERGRARSRRSPRRTTPARCARRTREAERLLLWKSRKQAFGAIGRLGPSYCTQDGVVPRTKLPHILRFITGDRREVRHPDRQRLPRRRRQHPPDPAVRRARRRPGASACWPPATRSSTSASACGGSVTGEHGIGVEKIDFMPKLFTPGRPGDDGRGCATAFNPDNRCSPREDAADGGGVHRAAQGGAAGDVEDPA